MEQNKITEDIFQERYLKHQKHKKKQLTSTYGEKYKPFEKNMKNIYTKLLQSRRSQRIFNSETISDEELEYILKCLVETPSSCNRQAISIKVISDRDSKELLGGLLVGGVGWCHRANKILLFFSNSEAYKEGLDYMQYLDTGVLIMNAYLSCEVQNIGCCFINPNVRKENINIFKEKFSNKVFCGALAIGKYDKKALYSEKIASYEIIK